MNQPVMLDPIRVDAVTHSLPAYIPVPGFGILPVNAFVIRGAEPVLVDTGFSGLRGPFLEALSAVVPPEELSWIWITHMDPDHMGNLQAVLDLAPKARVVTTYLGMGKLGLHALPQDRVYLLNPGQDLEMPDRTLSCLRPPVFDAPETTALLDRATDNLFSSDAFGGLMDKAAEYASLIPANTLREGMVTWATVDAPWLRWVEPEAFRQSLAVIRRLAPSRILSSHLPPADAGMQQTLFDHLDAARSATPFTGPDQAALEAMMAA